MQVEEQIRKELEFVKRDKERLIEKNSDLSLAMKEISDDFKLYKEENERLKERIYINERSALTNVNGYPAESH